MSGSPFNPLESLTIPSPCTADWDSMRGNEQVRFCQHCNLSVHNLSSMTRFEAKRLVKKSQGRLCIRYYRRPDGSVQVVTDKLHNIKRRASKIAAGAFGATLSLCASAAAQSTPTTQPSAASLVQISGQSNRAQADRQSGVFDASLAGTVVDSQGAVVPRASVTLVDENTKRELTLSTNDEGAFRFQSLPTGNYTLRVSSPGFVPKEIQSLALLSNAGQPLEVKLDVAEALGGVMVMTISPVDELVSAASADDLDKVKKLLAAGAEVNVMDTATDTTALMEAVDNGNQEMVKVLLSAGADVNAKNKNGRTALMSMDDETTAETIKTLISAGADVNWKAEDGNTPLLLVAKDENLPALQALLDAGAKVNEKNEDGKTALMVAAQNGNIENVKALLAAGADINETCDDDSTALKLAQENDEPEVVELLKAHGALEKIDD
jgi:hypothetical protein